MEGCEKLTNFKSPPHPQEQARHRAHHPAVLAFHSEAKKHVRAIVQNEAKHVYSGPWPPYLRSTAAPNAENCTQKTWRGGQKHFAAFNASVARKAPFCTFFAQICSVL